MNATQSATVTLDSKAVDAALGLLAEAARDLPPSPREQKLYRVFAASADVAIYSVVLGYALIAAALLTEEESASFMAVSMAAGMCFLVFISASSVGVVAMLLNLRFYRRLFEQRRQLRRRGVDALARALRRARQRKRLFQRLREGLTMALGATFVVGGVGAAVLIPIASRFLNLPRLSDQTPPPGEPLDPLVFAIQMAAMAVIGAFLLLSRVLRNTRTEIDIASSAEDLRRGLAELRATAGADEKIKVPASLIERAAQIESVLIEKERSRAIVERARPGHEGLAISFDARAAAQRAQLPADARLELEDLIAQVSSDGLAGLPTDGTRAEPQELRIAQSSPTGRVQAIFTGGRAPGAARVVDVHLVRPAADAPSPEQDPRHD